jgi:hypothetical protein
MFSAGKKRFTGGFLFIQKKAALMQKAARSKKIGPASPAFLEGAWRLAT